MANVASVLNRELGKLFLPLGVAGVELSLEATMSVQQDGEYDPRTAMKANVEFYSDLTESYEPPAPATIRLIPKSSISRNGAQGRDEVVSQQAFLMQPIPGWNSTEMMDRQLEVFDNTYTVTGCKVIALGPSQVLWEIACQ